MAIARTAMVDDDGSGTTGTIINNAWKTELYNQIDAADVAAAGPGIVAAAWTPGLIDFSGGSAAAYAARTGHYVRIGNCVFITGRIALTNKGTLTSGVGAIVIDSLPFPTANYGSIAIGNWAGLTTAMSWVGAAVNTGVSYITLMCTPAAAANVNPLLGTQISNTFEVWFGGTYYTTAP